VKPGLADLGGDDCVFSGGGDENPANRSLLVVSNRRIGLGFAGQSAFRPYQLALISARVLAVSLAGGIRTSGIRRHVFCRIRFITAPVRCELRLAELSGFERGGAGRVVHYRGRGRIAAVARSSDADLE